MQPVFVPPNINIKNRYKCPVCSLLLSKADKKCPHCSTVITDDIREWMTKDLKKRTREGIVALAIIMLLILIFILGLGIFVAGDSSGN